MIVRNFFSSLFLILVLFALQACGGKSDGDNNTFSTNINHTQQPIPATVIASSTTDSDEQEPDDNTHLASFYFSYDDSASTASKDLTLASLSASQKPNTHWGRPYEFLNAEVFNHFNAEVIEPFEISFGIYAAADGEVPLSAEPSDNLYALGVNLSGPTMTHEQRPNVVLTLLVDVSGSMDSTYATQTYDNIHSLLDVAKHGLQTMLGSLKPGDVLNLVTFSDSAEVVQQDWAYDSSNADFSESIHALRTTGSTNLNAGIALAYTTALSSYDSIKANRVIILTDAYANRGEINPAVIAEHTLINGMEGIHFAGIGIGPGFNDSFLNELTDIGKSVYSAMITPGDAERIFDDGFMNFIDSAVENVKFKLDYPQNFHHLISAAEEISENEEAVNSSNFAYNSQQFFFELFTAEAVSDNDTFTLTIYYQNAEGEAQKIIVERTLAQLLEAGGEEQIKSAAAITSLAQLVAEQLHCDTVLNSSLYAESNISTLFTTYKHAIESFCSLPETMN